MPTGNCSSQAVHRQLHPDRGLIFSNIFPGSGSLLHRTILLLPLFCSHPTLYGYFQVIRALFVGWQNFFQGDHKFVFTIVPMCPALTEKILGSHPFRVRVSNQQIGLWQGFMFHWFESRDFMSPIVTVTHSGILLIGSQNLCLLR